ncbi:MAG: site-specific integrase [Chloroflexi bacterium]|nr:site-specific integrase [Chloroflexota bacterium]
MKGSVTKVKSKTGDTWRIFTDGPRGIGGRRNRITRRVKGTKSEANRELRKLIKEVEDQTFVRPTDITVREFIETRYLPVIEASVRATTFENMVRYVRAYISKNIGDMKISDLTTERVQELYSFLSERGGRNGRPLAARTVLKVHQALRNALDRAVDWELVARNVATRAVHPRPERVEFQVLNPAQVEAMIEEIGQTNPWAETIVFLAFYTGLRRSELLGLRWLDLDLGRATLSVRRSYHRLDDRSSVINPPKTARSSRSVALTASTVTRLTMHLAEARRTAGIMGKKLDENDYLFPWKDGQPFRPDSVTQVFRRAAKKLGFTRLRFQDTRHTHASLLLLTGAHPKIVSERLGHASVAFTLDTYSHVLPGLQEAAADRLDQLMTGTGSIGPSSGTTAIGKTI